MAEEQDGESATTRTQAKYSVFTKDEEGNSPGQFGSLMCFALMIVGILISLITQHYATDIDIDVWDEGCPDDFLNACKASSAVLRVSMALVITYFVQMIGTAVLTKFYDYGWGFKFIIFSALVIGFFYVSTRVFDDNGYAWFARIIGFMFLILQQIILLDVAYSWNEKWLEYAGDDHEHPFWLGALIAVSGLLFAGSISAIGVMFWQFGGCTETDLILSLTIILCFFATIIQMFFSGGNGSILTSGIMTAYATYVAFSALTVNPDTDCNPTIGSSYQTLSTVIGMVLTIVSLSWTTYSTVCRVSTVVLQKESPSGNLQAVILPSEGATSGSASGSAAATQSTGGISSATSSPYDSPGLNTILVQVSLVFLLMSGYYAMVLTNWATLQNSGDISEPRTGDAAMWIQAAGQWIAILVYIWSLIAPILLPDREF